MVWDFLKKMIDNQDGKEKKAGEGKEEEKNSPSAAALPKDKNPGQDGIKSESAKQDDKKDGTGPEVKEVDKPGLKDKITRAMLKKVNLKDMKIDPKEATEAMKGKTDAELAKELDAVSPDLLGKAKTQQQKEMIIRVYRRLLSSGVDINDEAAVKRLITKHPEIMQDSDIIKVETFHRDHPKIGRNDPCFCGSGKKYKKCHGKGL